MNSWLPGEGEGIVKDFGKTMYTLLYLKWITNRHLLYSTLLNVMCQPRWEGCLGENEYIISMTESLHSSPETVTTLLIGCTPIQNVLALKKKIKKNFKKEEKTKAASSLDSNDSSNNDGGASGKESACRCRRRKRREFDPCVMKIPWRRIWQPTPVFLLENSLDRGVWWATVQGATRSQTRLSTHNIH